jgi:hypothetical protein
MPAWPQFPLPAWRPQRPLSDNAPLSDLPLPRTRRFALRVYITRVLCKLWDAAPAQLSAGALMAAPLHPWAKRAARLGRARPPGLPARHHFLSYVAPIMPGFPARPCFARAGPPSHGVSRFASGLSPVPVKRGGTPGRAPAPLGRGGRPCPPRSSRSRVRSFALAPTPRASVVCGAPHRPSISPKPPPYAPRPGPGAARRALSMVI